MSAARPLYRNIDYLLLWGGQVVSTFGSTSTSVVYPLLVLAMTGSPAAAGTILALRSVPYLVFSLPAGALIDRWNRKRVMILCDLGRALAIATIPVGLWLDTLTLWQLCVVALIEGSLFVFFNIAEVAALPQLVPADQLPQATAQNEASFAAASILAPSIGTALYQAFGKAVPFVADVLSYLVSAATLASITTPFHTERVSASRALSREIGEGLRWLWQNRLIRFMAVLTGGINFVNAGVPLILIVLAKKSGATNLETGLIFSIGGLGQIVGSLVGGRLRRRFSFGQVILSVLWVNALLLPLYLLSTRVVWLGIVYALISTTSPIYNVVQLSYRLSLIPDALQGRVNSTFRLLAFGLLPAGAVFAGFILERTSVLTTILFFTAWYLLLAIVSTLNADLRHAEAIGRAV
jgi:predicted MFS family arabinose efflux permease